MLRCLIILIIFMTGMSFAADRLFEAHQWFIKGKYYFNNEKNYEQAYYAFKKALELYPEHEEAKQYYEKTISVIKLLNITLQQEIEKEAERKRKEEEDRARKQAEIERKQREEEMLRLQKEKQKQLPGLDEFHFQRGIQLLSEGKTGLAREEFETSLEQYPENIKCRMELLKIYEYEGNQKKILEQISEIEKFYKPFYLLKQYKKEANSQQVSEKLSELEKYYKYIPQDSLIDEIHGIIQCYINRSCLNAIISFRNSEVKIARKFHEYNDFPFLNTGITVNEMKELNQQELIKEKRIEKQFICPDGGAYTFDNGVKCTKHSIFKRTVDEILAVKNIAYNPHLVHEAEVFNQKGRALFEKKMNQAALIQYEKAVEICPDYPDSYNNIGEVWYSSGEYQKALEYFAQAVEKKFNFVEAINNKGLSYMKLKKYDEAEIEFKKGLSIQRASAELHYNMALLLFEKNDLENAMKSLKTAVIINPNDPAIHYYMGRIYEQNGNRDSARKEYEFVKNLVPRSGEMYNMIEDKIRMMGE